MANRGMFDNWFQTPERKKEAENYYFNKMFPFGIQQQQWENEMMDQLIEDKSRMQLVKYVCFARREMYIDGTAKDDDMTNNEEYKRLLKKMKITEQECSIIENYSKLVTQASCMEELPTIEQIKQ